MSKRNVIGLMQSIIDNEGEGVILRRPSSLYESGRTESLLKLKAVRGDREGLVLDVNPDKSLLLQLPTGETFQIAKKNVQSELSPVRGDIVSFTFDNYSRSSAPTNPKVVRIRKDISWREVLHDAEILTPKSQSLNEKTKKVVGDKIKPMGYWKAEKRKNMRLFFENIAKSRNMDPLLPESWYSISQTYVKSCKGGNAVLWHYKGSYIKALQDLLPEMKLDVRKFANMPMNFWTDVRNRRQFFVNMAHKLGFDPLIPENWYSIDEETILLHKGAASVEFYHRGFARALLHLFPEIDFDMSKFVALPYNHWLDIDNRRAYLCQFAQAKGFDPSSSSSWYTILKNRLLSPKDLSALLSFYKGNIIDALLHLFPDINLDPVKLLSLSKGDHWKDANNRRNFFLQIAKEQGFDPFDVSNWCNITPDVIASSIGANSVLAFYKGSYVQALQHLFPELVVNETKFSNASSPSILTHHMTEIAHRKKLELFAREKGFDPLVVANWYRVPKSVIMAMKGATSLFHVYGNSYSRAVMHLFPELIWDIGNFVRVIEFNRKQFFVDFAQAKGIDYMKADDWYKVRSGEVLAAKGADAVLRNYDGNFGKALAHLFPNLGINMKKFESPPKLRWKNPTVRRQFFLDYAHANSFNPEDPNKWYPLTHDAILSHKGARSVLWYYGGSFAKALVDLFPDVPFNPRLFMHSPYSFWKAEKNRREFFEHFAKEEGFSPLEADRWYRVIDRLHIRKGINSVLHHHEGSVAKALAQLFPEVAFDQTKFKVKVEPYWTTKQNQKKFLKNFATAHSFDPLIPNNWSSISEAQLLATKGGKAVLAGRSFPQVLASVFPEFNTVGNEPV